MAWTLILVARARAGFTLMEMVVVVAIIAVAVTLSTPSLMRALDRHTASQVFSTLNGELARMRQDAVLDARHIRNDEVRQRLDSVSPHDWSVRVSETVAYSPSGYCPGGDLEALDASERTTRVALASGNCFMDRE